MSEQAIWYGTMKVTPEGPIAAGTYGTWVLTHTVGRYGMDNGGRLRLLFRYAWDGGIFQTSDPSADNYVTAKTSNPLATVRITFMPKGGRRPWLPCLVLEIKDDSMAEGDQVFITIGDTSGGSRGHRAQSFVESDFRWLTDVECFETGTWIEVENSPVCPVLAAAPYRLVGLAPSETAVDAPFHFTMKCEDRHGNPTAWRGTVDVKLERLDESGEATVCAETVWEGPSSQLMEESDDGCVRLNNLRFNEPGLYRFRLAAEKATGLSDAVSNPFVVHSAAQPLTHYWGDMHAQYNNALGTGSVEEAMRYARDAGAIDFVGHQPNDFQFRQEGWDEVRNAMPQFHVPGEFIPFVGYEWSGNTPAGGDRNVHFLGDDGPLHRSSHWHIPDKSDAHMDRYPLDELYQTFQDRDDVLIVPHVGGRRCDISGYHDPRLEPVVEICSCHGRFEWLLHEAISNGYTIGVIGGSDDHTGRPGAAYPTSHSFGTRGGLAGVYAKELTRKGIFEALRARHTYATTGERIWLHVQTKDGQLMGDAWEGVQAPVIRVQAAGTKPIEKVEIMRNHDLVYSRPLFRPEDYSIQRVRVEWGGARVKGRGRHADWRGNIEVTGGRIVSATDVAFDHPQQGIKKQDEERVEWVSTTSGDHDALILDLEAGPETKLKISTGPAVEEICIQDLLNGPIRVECGGVDMYCKFELEPSVSGPASIDFEWQDSDVADLEAGRYAYWIRLVQKDGETAWSSPLYFTKTL